MTPDEVMVYSAMALVPAVASITGLLVLLAVHRRSMSVPLACLVFVTAVVGGMLLSNRLVHAFAYLLHGDGALAVVAAPITGAILTVPVALVFAVAVVVIARR
jgi:hypothetical protein